MTDTIFQKIIDGDLPADIVYEDDVCLAFKDLHPVAPTHVLLIPKQHIAKIGDAKSTDASLAIFLGIQWSISHLIVLNHYLLIYMY